VFVTLQKMVYKRYVKRGGKLCGPYYYESYRDKNGKVVSKFISGPSKKDELLNKLNPKVNRKLGKTLQGLFLIFLAFFIISLFFILILGVNNFTKNIASLIPDGIKETGFAVLETESIEQRFDASSVDLAIKEPAKAFGEIISKNKNKRMDFNLGKNNLRLYFDLLNYSEFVEGIAETTIVNETVNRITEQTNQIFFENETQTLIITGMTIGENSEETKLDLNEDGIKQTLENLDETKIEEIADNSVVSADNFQIEVNENNLNKPKPEYKWGYKVRLNDLKFMAKIDVTSDENISIYNENTLRIGRTLLSFEDLIKTGYKVRIESPVLEIPINLTIIINQTMVDVTLVNVAEENITEINLTEVNATIIDETKINVSELNATTNESFVNDTEINQAEINVTTNATIPVNETGNIVNEREEHIINNTDKNAGETGGGSGEGSETWQNQSSGQQENQIIESSSETEEAEKEGTEEKTDEKEKKNKKKPRQKNESELAGSYNAITENIIKFLRLTGKAITELVIGGDVEYANTYTIYIEKEFASSSSDENSTFASPSYEDLDGDGKVSVGDIIDLDPSLIILISKAEHLDSGRNFINDIYDYVIAKDNNWSESINSNEFVRVTFEKALAKNNDITLFAKSSGNSQIEVYRKDDNQLVTKFENINNENWYKVYLSGLGEGESYDIFDLKVLGNPLEFDYIVDPNDVAPNSHIWNATYNNAFISTGNSITIDNSGNTYVTGSSTLGIGIVTIKYNSTGGLVWMQNHSDSALFGQASGNGIFIDFSGNIYVAGNSHLSSGLISDCILIKYDNNGNYIWNTTVNGSTNSCIWYDIVNASNNIYVSGVNNVTPVYGKYDTNGNLLSYTYLSGPVATSYGISTDLSGNFYVISDFNTSLSANYNLYKYNSLGTLQWSKSYDSGAVDQPYDVVVDSSGNIYVTGNANSNAYTIKYDTDGNHLWNVTFSTMSSNAIRLDSSEDVYIGGANNSKYFIVKYNSTGQEIWNKLDITGTIRDIAIDSSDYIYVTGGSGNDIYTIKYNTTISDTTSPLVTINSPTSTACSTGAIAFNATLNEAGYCSYSLDSGVTNISMNTSNNLTFYNASTLSVGSYNVKYYCNDSSGNRNDSMNVDFSISTSCGGGGDTTSGGGGGGGGTVCTPEWNCTEWSLCINNTQKRICNDTKKCKKISGKPLEIQSCILNLIVQNETNLANWSEYCNTVYSFGDIINSNIFLKGERKIECQNKDKNCINGFEITECNSGVPVILRKASKCYKNYIEIYNINMNLVSRMELIKDAQEKLNIDFIFDNSNYCQYCYDGIKNYDEDGIDCSDKTGGSCPVCKQFKK